MGMAIMIERAKATAGGAGRRDFSRLLYWNSLDFFSEIPKSVRYCHRIFHPFFTSFRRITTMTTSFIFVTPYTCRFDCNMILKDLTPKFPEERKEA